jgi:hypothetical protein
LDRDDEIARGAYSVEGHPNLVPFLRFLSELERESDRGMVLIATSYIDNLLKQTIAAFLIPGAAQTSLLQGFNAPLGTLSTRIAAAASLGLISSREAKEADRLRKIRNIFAHQVHVSFADQNIAILCQNLEMSAKPHGDIVVNTRGQFSTSAVAVIMNLTNRPHYASKRRLTFTEWQY